MLTLTTTAATTIRALVHKSEAPPDSGIRIASDPAAGSLTLSLVAVPADDDQVVEESGARVFLQPQVTEFLADKALDAAPDPEGRVQFSITDQGA